MDNNNTTQKMPDDLRRKLELFTPMQKKFCEYRARGMKIADAAQKAGSTASDRPGLTRVGWNMENKVEGAKDYINWLMEQRARQACVDNIEIIEKLRRVYDEALDNGKYAEANKAAQLLGDMIGAFKQAPVADTSSRSSSTNEQPKNNVEAFKDPDESVKERARKLQSLLKDLD